MVPTRFTVVWLLSTHICRRLPLRATTTWFVRSARGGLRPIVIVGALSLSGDWTLQSPMLMHPDGKARSFTSRPVAERAESLNRAMETMLRGNPFVRAWQWRARAERRRYEGDNADALVSFQIAAEVLLFEVWALLLIDEGRTTSQVLDLRRDTSFASLVNPN